MNKAWIAIMMVLGSHTAMACDDASALETLQKAEAAKLLENAPTFRHGWEDGKIRLGFTAPKPAEHGCQLTMQLELPEEDLSEVNAYLDKNPAKRILLGAQGYSIPETALTSTTFNYIKSENSGFKANNADNKPLSDLHHSVEFMYQLLAQLRAEVSETSSNHQAWSEKIVSQELQSCKSKFAANNLDDACQCRIEKLRQKISGRQMELVNFILEQPYSAATGSLIGYTELSKNINFSCQLKKR